jgi:PAS domain S-box-containing protein
MKGRGRIAPVVHKREAHYRTLFERVPVALYRTTLAGQLVDANPALLQMLGYPNLAALLQVNVTDLYFDPSDRTREQALLARDGFVAGFEMRLWRRDGAVIWVRDNARAVRDRRGSQQYYEGSLEDITARRQAEEARARRESEMDALYATSLEIQSQHDLPALLRSVLARAVELAGGTLDAAAAGALFPARP